MSDMHIWMQEDEERRDGAVHPAPGLREAGRCDMGCQPDWHHDECAIYLPAAQPDPTPEPDATVSDPVALTDAERDALEVGAGLFGWATTEQATAQLAGVVQRIVAARVAEAVEQERAEACELETLWGAALERAILAERRLAARLALVAKIEALADQHEAVMDLVVPAPNLGERDSGRRLVRQLRALLTADD